MNLYLLKRNDRVGWGEYDSYVVVAADEFEARRIDPYGDRLNDDIDLCWDLKHVGTAAPDLTAGTIVCASFDAC